MYVVFTALTLLLATATVVQSRRWFAPEVQRWVTQEKAPASWQDAKLRCERDGAKLASPLNTRLFSFMKSIVSRNNHTSAYFIGTRANLADGQEVQYVSVEGTRLDDMPEEVFDAIDRLDPEPGCLSMDRHVIRVVSCEEPLPYICYSNETSTTSTTTPTPATALDLGYTYSEKTGHWYKPHGISVKWDEASATCEGEGGYLVILNDAVEARVVWDAIKYRFTYEVTWTGLRDRRPGGVQDWRSIHDEPVDQLYNVWAARRSNDKYHTCAVFYDMRQNDSNCQSSTTTFVCERDS